MNNVQNRTLCCKVGLYRNKFHQIISNGRKNAILRVRKDFFITDIKLT